MSQGLKRSRVVAGAGISLGATLGVTSAANAADFTVNDPSDFGSGTLRQAIIDANANGNPGTTDRILFQSNVSGTITLGSTLPTVSQPLEIMGPGASVIAVSGNNAHRILIGADDLTVSGLTLVDGNDAGYGAGIYGTSGTLTVERAVITSNESGSGDGGGIGVNGGDLTVRDSTISDNTGAYGGGIAISSASTVTITGSTLSGNTTGSNGGAIYGKGGATLTILSSTISGNHADSNGGGIYTEDSAVNPEMANTVVANNTAGGLGPDLRGGAGDTFDIGLSLIEDPSGIGIVAIGPNVTGQDPQLGPLGPNGGPTPTHPLSPTSPALDRGSATGTDQRGLPRAFDFPALANATGGNGADIGAFELQGDSCAGKIESRPASLTGTSAADVIVGTTAADVIRAGGGNDLVCAGSGNDKVRGGKGGDTLRGEAGRDTLRGQGGRDRLIGGGGRDLLIGGLLRDILRGGPGRDRQRQ